MGKSHAATVLGASLFLARLAGPFTRSKAWKGRQLAKAILVGSLTTLSIIPPVLAQQTLDQATEEQLEVTCLLLRRGESSPDFGPQLGAICDPDNNVTQGSGLSAGGTAATTQSNPIVLQRLGALREKKAEEEGLLLAGLGASDVAAADASVDLPSGLSLFIASDYESRDRDPTTFETGYDSHAWGATAGADYRFADWLVAGLAFNFNRWTGDFEGGEDFAVDSYGPIAYASVFPLPGVFAQAVLAYARKDYDRSRPVSWSNQASNALLISGTASGDYKGDEFTAQVLAGYDHPIGRFTIGPRAGFSYVYNGYDGYRETGRFRAGELAVAPEFNPSTPTGLELAFDDDSRTSLQSILGVNAAAAWRIDGAVIVPQLFFDWRHEFRDDQRAIVVRFAQDDRPDPQRFNFNTEPPDRDFFNLGGGVSVLFENGLQPFVAAQTLLGHDDFESTSVFFGLRMSLN